MKDGHAVPAQLEQLRNHFEVSPSKYDDCRRAAKHRCNQLFKQGPPAAVICSVIVVMEMQDVAQPKCPADGQENKLANGAAAACDVDMCHTGRRKTRAKQRKDRAAKKSNGRRQHAAVKSQGTTGHANRRPGNAVFVRCLGRLGGNNPSGGQYRRHAPVRLELTIRTVRVRSPSVSASSRFAKSNSQSTNVLPPARAVVMQFALLRADAPPQR